MSKKVIQTKLGTFSPNNLKPFHNWYPYIEGYSSELIESILRTLPEGLSKIMDPFGGSGTTPLVSVQNNIPAYYCETNPFMAMVIDAKTNAVRRIIKNKTTHKLVDFKNTIKHMDFSPAPEIINWGGFEKYYNLEQLNIILQIKNKIKQIDDPDIEEILMVLLSSISVQSSLMIRRGDLRFARENEKKDSDFEVQDLFLNKLETAIIDITEHGSELQCDSYMISSDVREIEIINEIDCVITSPPYLNGTNYIRNTKLELKLNDFIQNESELSELHSLGIIAGINNVSKRKEIKNILPCVQPYYDLVKKNSYDHRIEKMIAGYFYDMNDVILKLKNAMKDDSILIIDIGDSQFNGIHIPTHDILSTICIKHGFEKINETTLRNRTSKNGMVLSQKLLKFKLSKNKKDEDFILTMAEKFIKDLPYREHPYDSRNWGHPWHSLCSYHGKLKPSIAFHIINTFTKKGDVILDPLCGVGTIPFEACLQGRIGIGNDLSELAYVVTKSKLEKPDKNLVIAELENLKKYMDQNLNEYKDNDTYNDFGFNGKIPTYFHPDTYAEILCARDYFKNKIKELNSAECMVFSAFLHIVHGNRPYALSRNSHPLTPYAPKGEFIYKNVIQHINNKINITYSKNNFTSYCCGKAILGDYKNIKLPKNSVDYVISSPPFANSIRFYMQNWMRLWLCGWEPTDYKKADEIFLDHKQKNNFQIYESFFEVCDYVLKDDGVVILHLGKTDKIDMAAELSKYASKYFKTIYIGNEDVRTLEKHGIKDKGSTLMHQFLFLKKL